jgi:predicted Zn-dependent protease
MGIETREKIHYFAIFAFAGLKRAERISRPELPAMRRILFALVPLISAAQTPLSEKEAALGRQMVVEVRRTSTPVKIPELQSYVSQLGARLAPGFVFEVVSMDATEPIVLPGRYVFVPLSLLTAANDEAEFAGMLAQAVARGPRRWAGLAPQQQRGSEITADSAAARTMSQAGFDPAALLRCIERLHPDDESRIAALRETIRAIPRGDWKVSDRFSEVQALVRPKPRTPPSLFNK